MNHVIKIAQGFFKTDQDFPSESISKLQVGFSDNRNFSPLFQRTFRCGLTTILVWLWDVTYGAVNMCWGVVVVRACFSLLCGPLALLGGGASTSTLPLSSLSFYPLRLPIPLHNQLERQPIPPPANP
jgi:hypothetical protein